MPETKELKSQRLYLERNKRFRIPFNGQAIDRSIDMEENIHKCRWGQVSQAHKSPKQC